MTFITGEVRDSLIDELIETREALVAIRVAAEPLRTLPKDFLEDFPQLKTIFAQLDDLPEAERAERT
jgi:hypothetical protein